MKKFIITVSILVVLALAVDAAYFRLGWYIDFRPNAPVETFMKVEDDEIMMDDGEGYKPFEIKGVNLGSGEPGEWSTDFDIDKESYLQWFR